MSDSIPIIELVGDEGETMQFEHIMTLGYKDEDFIILSPIDEEDEEEKSIAIFKVDIDDEGKEIYLRIEDDEKLEEVFEAFVEVSGTDIPIN